MAEIQYIDRAYIEAKIAELEAACPEPEFESPDWLNLQHYRAALALFD